MFMKKWFLSGLCFLLSFTQPVLAQPSLALEDRVDLAIVIDKESENVTCIKDAINPEKWYYVVTRPRLGTYKLICKTERPKFSLIQHQTASRSDSQMLVKCGVIKAAINLALPPEGINRLKDSLAKITSLPTSKMILEHLPMNSAKFAIYAPDGKLMGEANTAPDIAPCFDNKSIPIQINLENTTAEFVDALTKGSNGVFAALIFDYNGITPRCNLKVTIDWDQTFRHFSGSSKAVSECANLLLGNGTDQSMATLRESLIKNKCIKVESLTGESFKAEETDAYLMPILQTISNKIFNTEFPQKITPDKAASHAIASNRWAIANEITFSLKDSKSVKKGNTAYSMNRQFMVSRQIIAGGKIGIGNYPQKVQDELVEVIPPANWEYAWYSLPEVGFGDHFQLEGISIEVSVVDEKGISISYVARQDLKWLSQDGWQNSKSKNRTSLIFPLAEIYEKYQGNPAKLLYKQKINLTWNIGTSRKQAAFETLVPVFNDGIPVSRPASAIKCIKINGNLLTWARKNYPAYVPAAYADQPSDLEGTSVVLESAKTGHSFAAALKQNTTSVYVLLNKGSAFEEPEIRVKITYQSRKNKKTLAINNIMEEFGDQILLSDLDYLPEQ